MKVIDSGHKYKLDHLDGEGCQILTFVKREGEKYPGNVGHYEGTTMQEVIRALIERLEYVNNQNRCAETEAVLELMKTALLLLEIRASRKHGLSLDLKSLLQVVLHSTCPECGHLHCEHRNVQRTP